MKIKEILLSSAISTVVTLAAVYIFEEYVRPEPEIRTIANPVPVPMEVMPIPAEKKKKLCDRWQDLKATAVKKKLLDEIESRDISITIHLSKGEKNETN